MAANLAPPPKEPMPGETLSGDTPGQPMVVIAIVSTNEAHNIVCCLTSLAAATYDKFSIIICENGGEEGFQRTGRSVAELDVLRPAAPRRGETAVVPLHPGVDFEFLAGGQRITILRAPRNLGYAGGVNACIAAAGTTGWDAIWVLNPDTFPEPTALAALVERQKAGRYGIVGSRLVSVSGELVQTWGGVEWHPW